MAWWFDSLIFNSVSIISVDGSVTMKGSNYGYPKFRCNLVDEI